MGLRVHNSQEIEIERKLLFRLSDNRLVILKWLKNLNEIKRQPPSDNPKPIII